MLLPPLVAMGLLSAGGVQASPYKGVVPGRPQVPPHVHAGAGAHTCSWPGFQVLPDGRTRFFLLLSQPVPVRSSRSGDRFVLELPGVRVSHRNNLRSLETRFFPTPVVRAKLRRQGRKGLRFVLELKPGTADPIVRSEPAPGGYTYVFVEFPPAGG